MKLELDKIATRRAQLNAAHRQIARPMAYLTERVNSDLLERINAHRQKLSRWLVIDFHASNLRLPGNEIMRISPLEGDSIERINALAGSNIQAALINIQLAWLDQIALFTALRKIIAPGGRLFCLTLGPDTLAELRYAWSLADDKPHIHPFIDLHQLGDQLSASGFSQTVMTADWVGVEYDDIDLLMQDLRQEGFHNVLANRRNTLTGKNRLQQVRRYFESLDTPIQMTFEFIHGYAEVPHPKPSVVMVDAPVLSGR